MCYQSTWLFVKIGLVSDKEKGEKLLLSMFYDWKCTLYTSVPIDLYQRPLTDVWMQKVVPADLCFFLKCVKLHSLMNNTLGSMSTEKTQQQKWYGQWQIWWWQMIDDVPPKTTSSHLSKAFCQPTLYLWWWWWWWWWWYVWRPPKRRAGERQVPHWVTDCS